MFPGWNLRSVGRLWTIQDNDDNFLPKFDHCPWVVQIKQIISHSRKQLIYQELNAFNGARVQLTAQSQFENYLSYERH